MVKLFIDESGTLTNNVKNTRESFFVIAIIHVKNERSLKSSFKRFLNKYENKLRIIDTKNKIFKPNGDFLELKGSALTSEMKLLFLDFICKNDNLKVFYVKVTNFLLKDSLVKNKEVGFNFILDKLLNYKISKEFLPKNKKNYIQLDQRSVSTKLRYTLEDFLYRSLILDSDLISDLELYYRDSQNVHLIQVADFFANLLYSNCFTDKYKKALEEKRLQGYISHEYNFPFIP